MGETKGTIVVTYKAITRPILEYVSTIWSPIASDTVYTPWSCHNGLANPVQIVSTPPIPSNGGRLPFFWASRPCGHAGWLAMLLMKVGDVETNPAPTTIHKQVWICDICHRQIQVRKQISIGCNRIEHWVHLRCAGIRLAQRIQTHNPHRHNTTPPSQNLAHTSPNPTPALSSPSHTNSLAANTHATQTTVHASQSPQQPHPRHRVPQQPHRQTKDYHSTTNTTQTQQ